MSINQFRAIDKGKPSLPSIPHLLQYEEESTQRFWRALRKKDQIALSDLMDHVRLYLTEISVAVQSIPLELFLLLLILEEQKEINKLKAILEMIKPR